MVRLRPEFAWLSRVHLSSGLCLQFPVIGHLSAAICPLQTLARLPFSAPGTLSPSRKTLPGAPGDAPGPPQDPAGVPGPTQGALQRPEEPGPEGPGRSCTQPARSKGAAGAKPNPDPGIQRGVGRPP